MDFSMRWGPLPVWAWGTIAALSVAAVVGSRKAKNISAVNDAPPVRTVGVTQVQPVLITPQGAPSSALADTNAAANYYGGI
jgi:hypothetical protein